jgi:hypothetical protein
MDCEQLLAHVLEALQRERRISYRVLRRHFALSDDDLADLKDELIYAKQLAVDEDDRVLVWRGDTAIASSPVPSTRAALSQMEFNKAYFLDFLATAYEHDGQPATALTALAEALLLVEKNGAR